MPIPQEIVLIERLNQEFDQIEQDIFMGLALVRRNLAFFPNNILVTQYFAYLNAISLAIGNYCRQLQAINDTLSTKDIPDQVIQEAEEDLGLLLGRVLDTKIAVEQIINRLELIS